MSPLITKRPFLRKLTVKELVVATLVLTLFFEIVTLIFRFGFGYDATRDTASSIGRFTLGIRIHHAYLGVLLLAVSLWFRKRYPALSPIGIVVGSAVVLSDLVHHFLVLWPILGDPMFHLVYP